MLDYRALFDDLAGIGLESWCDALQGLLRQKFSASAHGNLDDWRSILSRLPALQKMPAELNTPVVTIPAADGLCRSAIRESLLRLRPWRKGPFDIHGVYIDAEWRSDLKWARVRDSIAPLAGRAVLDVGCGNGYYALRMRGSGAKLVLGVDPSLLCVIQFLSVCHFMQAEPVHLLPVRLGELPRDSHVFDTAFSMGVLYHQRAPQEHLRELRSVLRPGGELVLETLILPGTQAIARQPKQRYARMRNVWYLPTLPLLESWLRQAGFADPRLLDVSRTTTAEQRRTEWMPFESLAEALDPGDAARTIEGWPAPCRAALACSRP
jgi:tRNA (mo5U34)-methyltransferase